MVTAFLLDVSLLIALADEKHVANTKVRQWFLGLNGKPWATCAITQAGFVRIASNPRFLTPPIALWEAMELLTRLTRRPDHRFWTTDIALAEAVQSLQERLFSHRQVTDAYLLGLAIKHNGRLVTLDRGIEVLAGKEFAQHVLLLH